MHIDQGVKTVITLVAVAIISFFVAYLVIPERSAVEGECATEPIGSIAAIPEPEPEPESVPELESEPAAQIPAVQPPPPALQPSIPAVAQPSIPAAQQSPDIVDSATVEPATPRAPTQPGRIRIEQAAVCTGVINRAPQGISNRFSENQGTLYFFTHIVGVRDTVDIIHRWYREGTLVRSSRLPVMSPNWRTFSRYNISGLENKTGNWKVEVLEPGTRRVMETVTFVVE
ncbi:MAG: DUF2914 domain-containing protein [Chitinispirillales bacterium]|nr:DUF2914 domain-containing protein [Chitinispirillales bacterium]